MHLSIGLHAVMLLAGLSLASRPSLNTDQDYRDDYYDSEDNNAAANTTCQLGRRCWRTISDEPVKERPFMSIGCPRRAGLRYAAGKVYVILVSPTSFEDVRIKLEPEDLDSSVRRLIGAGFNVSQNSVMYAHGWTGGPKEEWGRKVRRRYASVFARRCAPTYNLLFLDYTQDAWFPYRRSVAKLPALGALLANFLDALRPHGCLMDSFHILGFSLSAHLVGIAGLMLRELNNPIRQITGLDPAGPCFFRDTPFSHEYTLGPDAAKLVVTRHYGYNKLGAHALVGGLDILVNGKNQPADFRSAGGYAKFKMIYGASDHMAAVYHESGGVTNATCYDVAYKCANYTDFLDGACARCARGEENHCYTIGTLINGANRAPMPNYERNTRMFIKMGGKRYCLHHYQLVVQLKPGGAPIRLLRSALDKAKLKVRLSSSRSLAVAPKRMLTCANAIVYTALVTSETPLEPLMNVSLAIDSKLGATDELKGVASIRLNYMSHPSVSARRARSMTFCQSPVEPTSFTSCELETRGLAC